MEFKDELQTVYNYFYHEFHSLPRYRSWKTFIISKNLGIHHLEQGTQTSQGIKIRTDYYIVIDKKQWLLTRLKYGF